MTTQTTAHANEIATRFVPTTVGVNTDVNLIDWASRVQIFSGWSMQSLRNGSEWFWVGIPAHVRNTGVRAIRGAATLAEAYAIAAELIPAAERKLNKLHAQAAQLNEEN